MNEDQEVARLIKDLKSKDADIRLEAATKLYKLKDKAKPALSALIDALGDPNEYVRGWAVESIGIIGGASTIPLLLKVVKEGPFPKSDDDRGGIS